MDLVSIKSPVHPVLTNRLKAQETKDKVTALHVQLVIIVRWDQHSSTFVLQAITAQRAVVYLHSAEQELTIHKSEEPTLAIV
jgi:hypothetical protein